MTLLDGALLLIVLGVVLAAATIFAHYASGQ